MASKDILRKIPQIEKVLSTDEFQPLIDAHSRAVVTAILREDLDDIRRRAAQNGSVGEEDIELPAIRSRVEQKLAADAVPFYRRVINATGIVLHTGLGRSPLGTDALAALAARAGHPVRVEVDPETGERGGRDHGCAVLLQELTGCEAATVTNNNAAATLVILAALARGKKVIISHGELVEIGGSYRIPAIMEESGARLAAVGTTNRTHVHDYENAIDDETGMILKVHTSNYLVKGFTAEVDIAELAPVGAKHGIPVVHDLGSGCMVDLAARGISGEPHVRHSVEAGADLVCFSGDKLLGGPQSGIIVGKKDAVQRCRKHQLFRALRPDRLAYIALEATLRVYREGDEAAIKRIPSLRRLLKKPEHLLRDAEHLAGELGALEGISAEVVADTSRAGSGSLPTRELPTSAVSLAADGVAPQDLARLLRIGEPCIFTRVRDEQLILDVRTVADGEAQLIIDRMRELADSGMS